jgi:predicted RecA/RadA family phage recombinase
MAVTAEQLINARIPNTGRLVEGLVEAGETLYGGTMAFYDADGYVVPTAGGLKFAGIVRKTVDNSAGADGDQKVELYTEGDFVLPLTSVAQADLTPGLAYASDNYTCTLTSSSNSFIGNILRVAGTNLAEIRIDTQSRPDLIE